MLTSCFGLGFMPFASGTWGSIPAAVIFACICLLLPERNMQILVNTSVMAFIAILASVACVRFSPDVIVLSGKKDPGEIVADELAGQAVTFFGAYAYGGKNVFAVALAGFLLFRFFDITKLWPINKLEKLPAGWGILSDDLLAGVFAAITLNIGLYLYHSQMLTDLANLSGQMNALSASLLGSVQGLTEFLPVSSSGHLVLFEHVLNFNPETSQMVVFDLITHVGTVLAIVVIFRKSIISFLENLIITPKYGKNPIEIYKNSPSIHLLVLAMVSILVTGIIGVTLKDKFEAARGHLWLVGLMWCVTATLLLLTDFKKETRVSMRKISFMAAVVIGFAQGCAIMPGISRSGATICAAVLMGLHREWAVEYSFLLAIPTILAGTVVTLLQNSDQLSASGITVSTFICGAVSAFVVGMAALKLLIIFSKKKNFKIFAIYCYLLAVGVAVYLFIGNKGIH